MNSRIKNSQPLNSIFVILFTAGLTLMGFAPVYAHRVNLFAWVEGDTVYVESKFSGGRKVTGGKIIVTDPRGVELLTGETNKQGEFSFKIPQKSEIKIVLLAGMGYQAEWTIPREEIDPAAGADQTPPPMGPQRAADARARPPQASEATSSGPATSESNAEEIQLAVEKALDKKLKPVLKMLAELQQKGPTLGDVIGGIGYILGLVGLATYLRYRSKQ
ncbi:MAG: hypothetical protein JSW39_25080 [Desulfobacterales bacterium]|nr:MAG: hypothetical protein JSW39_25080 [Desulfobacterales bacterium]